MPFSLKTFNSMPVLSSSQILNKRFSRLNPVMLEEPFRATKHLRVERSEPRNSCNKEVMELLEGPVKAIDCLIGLKTCPRSNLCAFPEFWYDIGFAA